MAKLDEASFVIAFTDADLRLCDLGIFALAGIGNERAATSDPLYQRLAIAENVLHDRREIASVEARLTDASAPAAYAARYNPGPVEVRLRVGELARLVAGLDAFLARTDPATSDGRVIDPPEKVRPLRDRLAQALAAHEKRGVMRAREQELLA